MPDQPQRNAIVTGAGRGIGKGIALELAAQGWNITINYNASPDAAQEVKSQIESLGQTALLVRADIANPDHRENLVTQSLDHFQSIDLLVNNAGVTSRDRDDILHAKEQNWDWLMAINLKGPFFLTQRVAQTMIEHAPSTQSSPDSSDQPSYRSIINISSLSAYAVSTNRGDYCIAKAGLGMMTKLWAARLAQHNINVYEICPGIIESDMTAPVKEKYDKLILEEDPPIQPIRRWGKPSDVARAAAALASGQFPFTTGDTLNTDGGFHIRTL